MSLRLVQSEKSVNMQALLIIKTLFELIGQEQLKIAYISNGFDTKVYEQLSQNDLPIIQNIQRQSKFFEKGSILINHEDSELDLIAPFEFSLVFVDQENGLEEKIGSGTWSGMNL